MACVAKYANPNLNSVSMEELHWILKIQLISFATWSISVGCIKCSVLFTLHKLDVAPWWQTLLRVLIGMQIIFALFDASYQLGYFKVLTSWSCAVDMEDPCQGIYNAMVYFEGIFQISTDIIISLLPLAFLAKLRRPRLEKILIFSLMSMGLLASAFSVRKTIIQKQFSTGNFIDVTIAFYTYNCAELLFGILAASLFVAKSAIYELLEGVGINMTAIIRSMSGSSSKMTDISIRTANLDTVDTEEHRKKLSCL